ncbi:thiol-disulfide isomerase/thioredoxin [Ulvibacter sp. MAR_2010_11]|uniref:TlpA family protein disulfide reductase n=1 Tax=Ulvibacter sp. MAR_2010_11 TaxID=1250229 RepID=UPI000C2CA4F7|nr:TlpA disulfide reductase family protein [Ulvibacter sp. MAR_2010_11]PKA82053.1 thiol-disulfide isomerase/thioredoxin [Ulvibacter sp. MAR_2010_11]
MHFLRKNWGNIGLLLVIALFLIPQTGVPIRVALQRIISFSPSEVAQEDRKIVKNYNWNLINEAGDTVNFAQSEGKVSVINFWATWCPPCIAEMPSFQKLFDTYGNTVDFYFVTSEKPEVVQKFLQKKEYNFPVYFEPQQAPQPLQTTALPTTYLISKSGAIVIEKEGAADWNSEKVKRLIDELLSE